MMNVDLITNIMVWTSIFDFGIGILIAYFNALKKNRKNFVRNVRKLMKVVKD